MIVGAIVAGMLAALVIGGVMRESHPKSRPVSRQIPR